MDDVFEHLLEDSEVWYAERVPHYKPKCDLCDEEVNKYNEYTLPIAATWSNGEPCDIIKVGGFTLCKECRSKIYKTVENILPEEKIKKLNRKALDIKMGRCDE